MNKQYVTAEIMEYMVWLIELVSSEFFSGDKALAYKVLRDQGVWDFYIQSYDITHTLSAQNAIEEIRDILVAKEVI